MEVKKKRGRPKKNNLPEEIVNLIKEVENKQELIQEQQKQDVIEDIENNLEFIWDFPIGTNIEFFDTNCSYELTGYRPITRDKGLDFNPSWFTEVRESFLRTGHYCQFNRNTKAYRDFWNKEYRRCKNGMTVNGYTITGDNYFFLNYFQLMDLDNTDKAGGGRLYIFPAFYAGQYEWFHYVEMCRRLRLNACIMKSREVGYSESIAAIIANSYNSTRNSVNLVTAFNSDHLNNTLSKIWNCFSFINDNTDGGFFKLRQVIDKSDHKRASVYKMINGQKIESGWMSQVIGITADKPSKIRGYRSDLLIMEEAGSWVGSTKAYIQSTALVGPKGAQWGLRIVGGTSGDTGPALSGLRDMYYNPQTYAILPFRHKYTATGEECLTSFFMPCTKIMKDRKTFLSKRGYVDEDLAKAFHDNVRSSMSKSPQALVQHCAEFPYNDAEAFSLEGDNKFNKVLIAEQLTRIRALKQCPPIETGYLEYTFKDGKHAEENINGFKWIPNQNGKIKILEHPLWTLPSRKDEHGKIIWNPPQEKIKNLYVIGIDGIDIGSGQTSEYTKDPSDFCLIVFKRVFGLDAPQPVAVYKDRPNDIRECYRIAIKMAQYYNAVINIEATRQSIIPYARERKLLHLFMRRPRATLSESIRNTNKQYGTPATAAIIDHQTDLIADYINDYCEYIWFDEMLDELNRYTDENKRKFDIVASFAMALLADEELMGRVPKEVEVQQNTWQDIGYYTDEYGNTRWGVIPQQTQITVNFNNNFGQYVDTGYRTSDPRIYKDLF